MARGKKLGGSPPATEKPEILLRTIIEAVIEAKAMSFADWLALSPNPLVPLALPVSAGGQYQVTQAGVDAAHALTDQVWKARADFRQTIARKSFDRLSFTAIGDAVANSPAHLDPSEDPPSDKFYAAVAADFRAKLDALATKARGDVDRHIPCHLFDLNQGVAGFAVGPVKFLPRADWLTHHVTMRLPRSRGQFAGLRATARSGWPPSRLRRSSATDSPGLSADVPGYTSPRCS